jgi:hypothetical protein
VGLVLIAGGTVANGQNVAFLVALAFAVASSANLPTILYSLFWARFTTTGALCRRADAGWRHAEMEVRALTDHGARSGPRHAKRVAAAHRGVTGLRGRITP